MVLASYPLNGTIYKVVHRQRHIMTFGNLVAFGVGIGSAFALGLDVPGPYYFWFGLSCLSIAYLTSYNVALGICLILILNPLLFFIRNASPGSVVLAGARSEWMMTLIFVWLIKLSQNKCSWPRGLDVNILFLFLSYATAMAVVAPSLAAGLLGIRALVMPAVIYFVVRDCVNRQPGTSYLILNSALLSMAIIGILSIFWYYGNLEMKVLEYGGILIGGSGRTIFDHFFERLSSLIGGGPSNSGIFLGAGLMISLGLLQERVLSKRSKIIFIFSGSLCAYTSLLSVSYSVVILLMVALPMFAISRIASRRVKIVFLCITATLFLEVMIGTSIQGVTLISQIRKYSFVWQRAMPDDLGVWLIGGGLNAAGGGILRENVAPPILVDSGWPQILSMTGLIGTTAIISFLLFLVVTYYRLASFTRQMKISTRVYVCAVTAGCAALGLLVGSVHTAVIFRPAVDIIFYTLAAVMVSIYSNGRSRKPATLQREMQP